MSNRRIATLAALLLLISVAVAGFVVLRIRASEDYEIAKAAIEERHLYIIATVQAADTTNSPTRVRLPTITPFAKMTLGGSLVLPTKVSP